MEQAYITNQRAIVADLYNNVYEDLKLYLLRYTGDEMTAEDMLQELFIKLMAVDTITEQTARQLVFTMAKRMIIDDARHRSFVRRATEQYTHQAALYDNTNPQTDLQAKELAHWEERVLEIMPAKRAAVYNMYRKLELTTDEITEQTGLSKRTVETHIYNSTKEMRQQIRRVI